MIKKCCFFLRFVYPFAVGLLWDAEITPRLLGKRRTLRPASLLAFSQMNSGDSVITTR